MIRKLILAVALLAIAAVPMSVLAREDDRRELNGGREQLERHELERRPFFFGVYPEPFYAADRKSTRLNSNHRCISYAVFCLKKKNQTLTETATHHPHALPACAIFLSLPIGRRLASVYDKGIALDFEPHPCLTTRHHIATSAL